MGPAMRRPLPRVRPLPGDSYLSFWGGCQLFSAADRPLVPAYAPCRPGRLQRHLLSGEFDQLRDFPIFESNFVQVWSPGTPPICLRSPCSANCDCPPLSFALSISQVFHITPESSHLISPILWLVSGFRSLCLSFIDCTHLWFLPFNPKIFGPHPSFFSCGAVDDTQGLAHVRQELYHFATPTAPY